MLTSGESRFDGRIGGRDADRKRGSRGRRRLGPGQGSVSREGDRQAGSLHGGLIVSQLVNPLLLQQQSLLLTHAHKIKSGKTQIKKMNSPVVSLNCSVKRVKGRCIGRLKGRKMTLIYFILQVQLMAKRWQPKQMKQLRFFLCI